MQGTPTPLQLTSDIKRMIAEALPDSVMVLAAVSPEGKPVTSYRGSVSAYSDDQLSVWLRGAGGSTESAIAQNPNVSLAYRSKDVPMLYFEGRARIATRQDERDRAFEISNPAEQGFDPERKGTAVIIDLDAVHGVLALGPEGPSWCNMKRGA